MTRRILCFGDSNTHGTPPMTALGDLARFGPDIRWPCVMARELGSDWELIEEGHPSRTTVHDDSIEGTHKNGLRALPVVMESHKWIDVLVLMLGTNDTKGRFSLTAIDIALGVGRLADLVVASPYVDKLLIVCPPPVLERGCIAEIFHGAEARTANLADRMAKIVAARNVDFLDAGTVIESDPLDGVHFSEGSHAKLGAAVAAEVKRVTA